MAFYDTVRLEKGMYNTPGKSFTQVLEELDRRSHKIGNLKQFHVADHNT